MSAADDALAIANLKARYCRAADLAANDAAGARAEFAQLFTPDFVGDYGLGQPLNGGETLADFMVTAIAGGSAWMVHMLHSPLIVVDGDTATGDWTVLAHSKRHDGSRMEIVGRYADTFRRTAAGWRIAAIGFWRPEA